MSRYNISDIVFHEIKNCKYFIHDVKYVKSTLIGEEYLPEKKIYYAWLILPSGKLDKESELVFEENSEQVKNTF